MNKVIIPSILVVTALVAGVFALVPIDQATTVHTTIQSTQLEVQSVTGSVTRNAATDEGFTIDCDQNFMLLNLNLTGSQDNGADNLDIDEIIIDGFTYELEADLDVHDGNEVVSADLLGALIGLSAPDVPNAASTGMVATGAGANDMQFSITGDAVGGLADTIGVIATVLSQANVACTLTGS